MGSNLHLQNYLNQEVLLKRQQRQYWQAVQNQMGSPTQMQQMAGLGMSTSYNPLNSLSQFAGTSVPFAAAPTLYEMPPTPRTSFLARVGLWKPKASLRLKIGNLLLLFGNSTPTENTPFSSNEITT